MPKCLVATPSHAISRVPWALRGPLEPLERRAPREQRGSLALLALQANQELRALLAQPGLPVRMVRRVRMTSIRFLSTLAGVSSPLAETSLGRREALPGLRPPLPKAEGLL